MKKLIIALLLCSPLLAFDGHVSLNGLSTFLLFGAPTSGVYFVNGQLMLPDPTATQGGCQSQVVATVTAGASTSCLTNTVYTGVAGAKGFQVNQISLLGGSTVCVQLSSSQACDKALNAVSGGVVFGNTF